MDTKRIQREEFEELLGFKVSDDEWNECEYVYMNDNYFKDVQQFVDFFLLGDSEVMHRIIECLLKRYRVQNTTNGYVIRHCLTYEDAEEYVRYCENEEIALGTYTPGFYQITRLNEVTGEYVEVNGSEQ